MGVLVSQGDVEDYMSSPVVTDTYDDNNDGTIDPTAMARVISDAEAIVMGTLRGLYVLPLVPPIDPLLQTVTLMVVHCQATKRFPERFREKLTICQDAKDLIAQIRTGSLKLSHESASLAILQRSCFWKSFGDY